MKKNILVETPANDVTVAYKLLQVLDTARIVPRHVMTHPRNPREHHPKNFRPRNQKISWLDLVAVKSSCFIEVGRVKTKASSFKQIVSPGSLTHLQHHKGKHIK